MPLFLLSNLIVFLQAARCFISLRVCREISSETANEAERAALAEAVSGLSVVFPHSAAARSDTFELFGCGLHGYVRSEKREEMSHASETRNDLPQAEGGVTGPLALGCSECHREALENSVERVCRLREAKLDLALLRFWDLI